MPRDLRTERRAYDAMAEALKNAPRLGRYDPPRRRRVSVRAPFIVAAIVVAIPALVYIARNCT